MTAGSHTQRNIDYYDKLTAGKSDYWRLMAAPRFRVKTIQRVLAEAGPKSVVDFGCGDGALLFAIAQVVPDAKLVGVDLSSSQIEANRAVAPAIDWHVGNVESDEFVLPEQFDSAVSSEVIEHLGDPAKFLRRIAACVRPGGLLVLSTQSGRVGETERRVGHVRHFTTADMRTLLEQNGWTPVRVWNAGFPFHDLSKRLAN